MSENTSLSQAIFAERLGRSEVFADLCEEDRIAIAEFCCEMTYDEGDLVLVEGETADRLFIVERGKLALEKKIQLGRHSTARNATIGYITPGKAAGFSALTLPHIYSTSAVCVEPARVLVVDSGRLRAYLEANPAAGLKVMDVLVALVGERYRHAINTLTYFLSVVSHELRSPLAAIENYLETMLGGFTGELNPKQERFLQRCVIRVTDLRDQIGDVVDLARMRPEQIQTDFELLDFGVVGSQSLDDVRLAAAEKGITIEVQPPEKFFPIVGARRRLRQVFTNLLANAIRYSLPGSTVFYRAWYQPDELYVEVEDQGPGIRPEDLPHIFKEFFRASNVEGESGMGLGLSIAKKIVEAHYGDILVTSNTEEEKGPTGTRFTVIVPRNLKTPEMRRREWLAEEEDSEEARQ